MPGAHTLLAAAMASRLSPSLRWQAAWLSSAPRRTSFACALTSSLSLAKFVACSARSAADCKNETSKNQVQTLQFTYLACTLTSLSLAKIVACSTRSAVDCAGRAARIGSGNNSSAEQRAPHHLFCLLLGKHLVGGRVCGLLNQIRRIP